MRLTLFNVTNNREKSIDQLRGIAIWFVVLGHFLINNIQLTTGHNIFFISIIYAFHMPLFFIISGYLLYWTVQRYSLLENIKRKIYGLLIPYIMWSLFAAALRTFKLIKNGNAVNQSFVTSLLQVFYYEPSVWFLWILFIYSLVTLFITQLKNWKIQLVFHILMEGVFIFLISKEYFAFVSTEYFYPLFVLGIYINKFSAHFEEIRFKFHFVTIIFVLLCIVAYILESNLVTNMVYTYVWALSGCLFFYVLVKEYLPKLKSIGKIFNVFGIFSLDLYTIHIIFVRDIVYIPTVVRSNVLFFAWIYSPMYCIIISVGICFLSYYLLRRIPLFNVLLLGKRTLSTK